MITYHFSDRTLYICPSTADGKTYHGNVHFSVALIRPYIIYLPHYSLITSQSHWSDRTLYVCLTIQWSLLSRIDQTVRYISASLLNDYFSVALIRPCIINICLTTQWSLLIRTDQTVHYISAPLLTDHFSVALIRPYVIYLPHYSMITSQSHWSDRTWYICLTTQWSLLSRIDQTVCYVSAPVLLADGKTCHGNVHFALLRPYVIYLPQCCQHDHFSVALM